MFLLGKCKDRLEGYFITKVFTRVFARVFTKAFTRVFTNVFTNVFTKAYAKHIAKFIIFILPILAIASTSYATYGQELDLKHAGACILIDAKTGQVLYEKSANRQGLYPASTTKIMTAILAIEHGEMDQLMTASEAAVNDIGKDGMNIGIMAGEKIPMENLLHALMISSANETSNIIAENICPTRQEFVDLMNKKAKELGALNTHFANPCGAHNKNHYTTAADMAKIARYGMSLPKFREIASMVEYQMLPTNKHSEWPKLFTTNKILRYPNVSIWKSDLYTYSGIKTGFTVPAGFNLLCSAYNSSGMELITVVMDVSVDDYNAKNDVNIYTKRLLEYGFSNFSMQQIAQAGDLMKTQPVINAKANTNIDLVLEQGLQSILPNDKNLWNIRTELNINPQLTAPISKGAVLGNVIYFREETNLGTVNIIAASDVPEAKIFGIFNPSKKTNRNLLEKAGEKTSPFVVILLIFCGVFILFTGYIYYLRFTRKKRRSPYRF